MMAAVLVPALGTEGGPTFPLCIGDPLAGRGRQVSARSTPLTAPVDSGQGANNLIQTAELCCCSISLLHQLFENSSQLSHREEFTNTKQVHHERASACCLASGWLFSYLASRRVSSAQEAQQALHFETMLPETALGAPLQLLAKITNKAFSGTGSVAP